MREIRLNNNNPPPIANLGRLDGPGDRNIRQKTGLLGGQVLYVSGNWASRLKDWFANTRLGEFTRYRLNRRTTLEQKNRDAANTIRRAIQGLSQERYNNLLNGVRREEREFLVFRDPDRDVSDERDFLDGHKDEITPNLLGNIIGRID